MKSRKSGLFTDVKQTTSENLNHTYLWTIDKRGMNIAYEKTPLATPRGHVVHTNLSEKAYIAGEVWFVKNKEIILNYNSGRFCSGRNRPTEIQMQSAIEFWEHLGYKVTIQK